MKDFILIMAIILYLCKTYEYYTVKKDLEFYKPKYEKIREQYLELHDKFYEPIFNIINGNMIKIDYKLKDKYEEDEEDVKNG